MSLKPCCHLRLGQVTWLLHATELALFTCSLLNAQVEHQLIVVSWLLSLSLCCRGAYEEYAASTEWNEPTLAMACNSGGMHRFSHCNHFHLSASSAGQHLQLAPLPTPSTPPDVVSQSVVSVYFHVALSCTSAAAVAIGKLG